MGVIFAAKSSLLSLSQRSLPAAPPLTISKCEHSTSAIRGRALPPMASPLPAISHDRQHGGDAGAVHSDDTGSRRLGSERTLPLEDSIQSSNFDHHSCGDLIAVGEGIGGHRGAPGGVRCLPIIFSILSSENTSSSKRAALRCCRTMRVGVQIQNAWFAEHPRKRSDGGHPHQP